MESKPYNLSVHFLDILHIASTVGRLVNKLEWNWMESDVVYAGYYQRICLQGTKKITKTSRQPENGLKFQPGTSRIQAQRVTATPNTSVLRHYIPQQAQGHCRSKQTSQQDLRVHLLYNTKTELLERWNRHFWLAQQHPVDKSGTCEWGRQTSSVLTLYADWLWGLLAQHRG